MFESFIQLYNQFVLGYELFYRLDDFISLGRAQENVSWQDFSHPSHCRFMS